MAPPNNGLGCASYMPIVLLVSRERQLAPETMYVAAGAEKLFDTAIAAALAEIQFPMLPIVSRN